jgi:ribosome-associated translation inhibitor RaiA
MDIPLELSFHNMQPSDALKAAVQKHVSKLDGLGAHLVGCRVVIEMPHKNHRPGQNIPDVHIVLRVPGKELVVSRELAHAANRKTPTDAYSVLDAAFAAAQGQLKEHRRIVQGDVKYKERSAEERRRQSALEK